jgi:hypothetical protein
MKKMSAKNLAAGYSELTLENRISGHIPIEVMPDNKDTVYIEFENCKSKSEKNKA